MVPISAAESKLISIFVQTLLYGAYTVVFGMTCWVLVKKRPMGQPINKTMFSISLVMFILASLHIGINYTRIFRAFVTHAKAPGGPSAYFYHLSDFTQIFGSAVYVAQTLVGDSVVLYRCYLVWGRRSSIVAFPFLLLVGSTVSGIGILYSFVRVVPEAPIFEVRLRQWIVSFFSLTLSTNIICTTLHASRIWHVNRPSISFSEDSLRPVMLLVIESGAIYSTTLLLLLILYEAGSWFQYVLLDAVSPIVGLVFSMIIVRVGMGLTSMNGKSEDFGSNDVQRLPTRHPMRNIPRRLARHLSRDHHIGVSSDTPSLLYPSTMPGTTKNDIVNIGPFLAASPRESEELSARPSFAKQTV